MPANRKKPAAAPADPNAPLRDLRDRIDDLHDESADLVLPARAGETARHWLSRVVPDQDEQAAVLVMAEALMLAIDLETFTPSHTGTTAVDRLARRRQPKGDDERAFAALKAARFTPFVITSAIGPDRFAARNLVTQQDFTLFDDQLPSEVLGVPLVARLCTLADGIVSTVSVVTPLDDAGLAVALDFVRPGKANVNGPRCAAAVYRHVVRHGGPRIEGVNSVSDRIGDDDDAMAYEPTALDLLMIRHLGPNPGREDVPREPAPDILEEVRRLASVDTVLDALAKSVASRLLGVPVIEAVGRRFAEVQIEALHLRALAGSGSDRSPLDTLSQAIDHQIAMHGYPRDAADLFRDIRRVVTAVKPKADQEDLTRVIERIRGLRAKTIDQGCTEEEAMAAANKVAEMLDRYGLSLGEIDLRQQACLGFGIESTRKRSGPIDDCMPAVAFFCDCRAWTERTPAGTIRSVFFGLPADVEAARYLYERVATAFDTETAAFQAGSLYRDAPSGERRGATTSFQIGLARGIVERLRARKAERDATTFKASGRDLVPVKAAVVEDELAKLGLSFQSKNQRGRRVQPEAFRAGRVAGLQFEAQSELM